MRPLKSIILAAMLLSACGDKGPVTDMPAIYGDWSCRGDVDIDGARLDVYTQLRLDPDGSYGNRYNTRLVYQGSRMNVDRELTGRWKLSNWELKMDVRRNEMLSLSASGPEFAGMSDKDIEREMDASAENTFVGKLYVTSLSLGELVMQRQVDDYIFTNSCVRPEAARAAALAAAEEAKAIREAAN